VGGAPRPHRDSIPDSPAGSQSLYPTYRHVLYRHKFPVAVYPQQVYRLLQHAAPTNLAVQSLPLAQEMHEITSGPELPKGAQQCLNIAAAAPILRSDSYYQVTAIILPTATHVAGCELNDVAAS
jgi:hypothetical protein